MNRDDNILLAQVQQYLDSTGRDLRWMRFLNNVLAAASFIALCAALYLALKYSTVVGL